jgi:hypothetical protein
VSDIIIGVPLALLGGELIYDETRDRANTIDTGYDPNLDPNRANRDPQPVLEDLSELPGFPLDADLETDLGGFSEAPKDLLDPSIPGFGEGL